MKHLNAFFILSRKSPTFFLCVRFLPALFLLCCRLHRCAVLVFAPIFAGEVKQELGLSICWQVTHTEQVLLQFVHGLKHRLGGLPCQESLLGVFLL